MRAVKLSTMVISVLVLILIVSTGANSTRVLPYKHKNNVAVLYSVSSVAGFAATVYRKSLQDLASVVPAFLIAYFLYILANNKQFLFYRFNVIWFPWLVLGKVSVPTRAAPLCALAN